VRSDRKTKSKSTSVITPPTRRFSLFGDPLVLEGEDAAAYHELLAAATSLLITPFPARLSHRVNAIRAPQHWPQTP
jgi:hypothetical protein